MTPTKRVRSVLDALERHPSVAWVTRAQSGVVRNHGRIIHLCKAGTPDVIGCLANGRFFGLEVKATENERKRTRNTDSTRSAQDAFRERVSATGAVVAVVCSAEEAMKVVNQAIRGACTDAEVRTAVPDRGTEVR